MILRLAFLSILRRPARHMLLLLLLAAACALPVFLLQMTAGLYNGLNRAVEPFPILMGAKGSPYQLVINTVFLRDHPIGNIPYRDVEALRESGRADLVIPLAFGDNYRGFRIVGTEPALFEYKPNKTRGPWLSVAEGSAFAAPGDAVIGSETARRTGLTVGSTFRGIHGLTNGTGEEHGGTYRVTGILAPVGGPYDTAILVSIEDIWRAHRHETGGQVRRGGIVRRHSGAAQAQAAPAAAEPAEGVKGDVTAVLVHPTGYREAMQLLQEAQRARSSDSQLIFPAQTLIALYSMAGQSREFWELLTGGLIGAAVLITLLAMYWNGLSRLSEFALLRALGAGDSAVLRLLAAEQALLLLTGAAAGWLIGWGGSVLAAGAIEGRAAVVMTTAPEAVSLLPPLAVLVLGMAAGLIPAWLIRKKDVSSLL